MDWRLSHLDWKGWRGSKKNCSMKSFQDLVCPGHYKVTVGHHLLLRSPKGSLKHWFNLLSPLCLEASVFRKSGKSQPILKISDRKGNPGDLPGMELVTSLELVTQPILSLILRERANQFLKLVMEKVTQETSLGWKEALLWTRIILKEQFGVSSYEMLYGRPFVYVNEFFLIQRLRLSSLIPWPLGNSSRIPHLWGFNQDPKDSEEPPLYAPGTQVLIKVWKDGSPSAQLKPTWKDPYPVILSTSTAVKVTGHDSWIHYSWVKPWKKTEEDTQYTCEPLGYLRYLFRTTNECHSNEHSQN